jgi:hypothetical protein
MPSDAHETIDLEQRYVLQTYARPPFVLERGEGCWVYDTDGNAYLDCVAGIAVNALGHADPGLAAVLAEQAGRLWHVSNLYHTAPQARLAQKLCASSFVGSFAIGQRPTKGTSSPAVGRGLRPEQCHRGIHRRTGHLRRYMTPRESTGALRPCFPAHRRSMIHEQAARRRRPRGDRGTGSGEGGVTGDRRFCAAAQAVRRHNALLIR